MSNNINVLVDELKNSHDYLNDIIGELSKEIINFCGANKVTIMRSSLDVYIEFPEAYDELDELVDLLGGFLIGKYVMEKGRYTYCISLNNFRGDVY